MHRRLERCGPEPAGVGAPGYVAYTASKGAVIAMTKVAALEHAPDRIRVNAPAPAPCGRR